MGNGWHSFLVKAWGKERGEGDGGRERERQRRERQRREREAERERPMQEEDKAEISQAPRSPALRT